MRMPALAAAIAWIEEVERTWLGWTLPPPRRAIAEAAWAPDQPAAYCGRCGGSVGPGEADAGGCAGCRRIAVMTHSMVRLGAYTGPMREWVRAIKYRGWAEMGELLGGVLGRSVAHHAGARLPAHGELIVVPMPMPWQRRMYRGIDHARVIAAAVARELDAPVVPLLAQRNGPPQVALQKRLARRGGRVRLRRRAAGLALGGYSVVLVDDVRTTGASLDAAARQLRRLRPVLVLGAVLAAADAPGRGDTGRGAVGASGTAIGPAVPPWPAAAGVPQVAQLEPPTCLTRIPCRLESPLSAISWPPLCRAVVVRP